MDAILAYLEHQEYPEEFFKQQKRDLRKRAADFTLKDGMLHHYLGSRSNFSKAPRQSYFRQGNVNAATYYSVRKNATWFLT